MDKIVDNSYIRPQNKHLIPAKKGEVRNAKGRPRRTDVEKLKVLTKLEVEQAITAAILMTREERSTRAAAVNATAIEQMVLAVIDGCIKQKCYSRLAFLLDRIVGKPTEQVRVSVEKPSMRIEYLDGRVQTLSIEDGKGENENR